MPVTTRAQAKRNFSETVEPQQQKKAKLQGRTVSVTSICWRLLTISGICLLALGLLFIPVAMASPARCVGEQCHQVVPSPQQCSRPVVSNPALAYEAVRQCSSSQPRFSKNLAQYMIKGYRLTPDGKAACKLKNPPEDHQKCVDLAEEEIAYSEFATELTEEIMGFKISDLRTNNEKGNPGVHEGVKIELNPQRMLNYQNAVEYAENNILQDASFFSRSDDSILNSIKMIHQIAMKDILPNAGIFRENVMVVGHSGGTFLEALRKIKHIGTPDDVALIKQTIPKMYQDTDAAIKGFTPDQRRAWDKVLHICPMPEEVEPQMRQFVQQLKRHHADGMPAAQLACFAHNEIGRIHAFEDGNGRLSLIMLNTILKKAGLPEVVIPNDSDYTRKVLEDWNNPGALCRYIERQAIPWTNAHRIALELDDTV